MAVGHVRLQLSVCDDHAVKQRDVIFASGILSKVENVGSRRLRFFFFHLPATFTVSIFLLTLSMTCV